MRIISNFVQISLILAQRSTAPTRLLLSWKRACCLTYEQTAVITNGHFSRTAR